MCSSDLFPSHDRAAREFGKKLGIIFQIRDDIFDYSDSKEIGKPTGNDMTEGKLTLPAIYTFIKRDLGNVATKDLNTTKKMIFGALIGAVIGFYDGFFGPGTGSFFVLAFVMILGFDFLSASAYAKVVNCITNISALLVFISHGNYLLELAILMAVFNIAGNFLGTKIAFKKGNGFIRIVFLIIVMLMILRYSKEVFLDLI